MLSLKKSNDMNYWHIKEVNLKRLNSFPYCELTRRLSKLKKSDTLKDLERAEITFKRKYIWLIKTSLSINIIRNHNDKWKEELKITR